jgi:hypothetical protein
MFEVTGDFSDILTAQSLILLGIGSGTTFISSLIDSGKEENKAPLSENDKNKFGELASKVNNNIKLSKTEKKELNYYELQSSGNILKDIVTDANGDYNIHRVQIVIWTAILGLIFIYEVIVNFKFPEFDETLLTLQGISSATFLGLKAQGEEKKEPQNQTGEAGSQTTSQTGEAGSQTTSQTGEAGSQTTSQTGEAGSQTTSQTGEAGSQTASQTGEAGSQTTSQTGEAGSQTTSQTGEAGSQTTSQTGEAGSQTTSQTGEAGSQTTSQTGEAGGQTTSQTGETQQQSESFGSQVPVDPDAPGT